MMQPRSRVTPVLSTHTQITVAVSLCTANSIDHGQLEVQVLGSTALSFDQEFTIFILGPLEADALLACDHLYPRLVVGRVQVVLVHVDGVGTAAVHGVPRTLIALDLPRKVVLRGYHTEQDYKNKGDHPSLHSCFITKSYP
jgi:hypothetical protein